MTDPVPTQLGRRNPTLTAWLIIDTVVSVCAIPLALFWGLMSGMSTTTTDNAAFANTYVLVNLSIPLLLLVCLIGAWIAWTMRKDRAAWIIMFLPLIPFLISIGMLSAWPAT